MSKIFSQIVLFGSSGQGWFLRDPFHGAESTQLQKSIQPQLFKPIRLNSHQVSTTTQIKLARIMREVLYDLPKFLELSVPGNSVFSMFQQSKLVKFSRPAYRRLYKICSISDYRFRRQTVSQDPQLWIWNVSALTLMLQILFDWYS